MHPLLADASAIFFDLDGTLVDSAADIHIALNKTLIDNHFSTVTLEQVRGWIGRGAKVLVQSAFDYCVSKTGASHFDGNLQQVEALLSSFLIYYEQNVCENTQIYESVIPVLNALKQREKSLACITNKPIKPAHKLLDALDLSNYFTLILGGDSLPAKKPHPLPLQHALSHYSLKSDNAVMVGDSQFDVLAAQAANISCIAVSGGYNHGVPIEESNPSVVVSSFLELL